MDLLAVVSSNKFRPLGERIFVELLPVAVSDTLVMLSHVAGSTGRILKWQNGLLKPGTTIIFNKEAAIIPELDRPWDSHTVVILFEDDIYGYISRWDVSDEAETFIPFGEYIVIEPVQTQYSALDIDGVLNQELSERAHLFHIVSYSHALRKDISPEITHLWVAPIHCTKIRINSTEFYVTKLSDVLLVGCHEENT